MPRRVSREFIKRARMETTPRITPACRFDLAAVLDELCSFDDEVRARALDHLCPCRAPWEVYEQHIGIVSDLIKDPSWLVRQTALRIERESPRNRGCAGSPGASGDLCDARTPECASTQERGQVAGLAGAHR